MFRLSPSICLLLICSFVHIVASSSSNSLPMLFAVACPQFDCFLFKVNFTSHATEKVAGLASNITSMFFQISTFDQQSQTFFWSPGTYPFVQSVSLPGGNHSVIFKNSNSIDVLAFGADHDKLLVANGFELLLLDPKTKVSSHLLDFNSTTYPHNNGAFLHSRNAFLYATPPLTAVSGGLGLVQFSASDRPPTLTTWSTPSHIYWPLMSDATGTFVYANDASSYINNGTVNIVKINPVSRNVELICVIQPSSPPGILGTAFSGSATAVAIVSSTTDENVNVINVYSLPSGQMIATQNIPSVVADLVFVS